MAGIVRFPSGGSAGKGIYCWEQYKILDDSSKEFQKFVVSGNENKYPDGEMLGEYFYQRCYAENETVYLLTTSASEDTAYAYLVSTEAVELTASESDIRIGSIAVTDDGVTTGMMVTPSYHYAIIESDVCSEVIGTSKNYDGINGYVRIEKYNETYIGKYYRDGKWYTDNTFTTEWIL